MVSPIKQFYKGKNILLTGGTGFMGVMMVEKLLRSFPDVGSITMVVREKKGATVKERKKAYFDNQVFERLKKENGIDHGKINFVQGDIQRKNLGLLQATTEKLQDEVDLIIHGAAMLNFSLPLKFYIDTNLSATHDLLKIAEGCRKLKGFMYISTAYSQTKRGGNQNHTSETVIEHPISPRELLKMAEQMSINEMEACSKDLTLDWFNYYLYSKNATENLCTEFKKKFPIAIFRPSIVSHSYSEPAPFYLGNDLSFPKVLLEAGRGLTFFGNPAANANTVPVDITVYGAMAALYNTSQNRKLTVYNCTTNNHPCTYTDAFSYYANSIPDYEQVLVPYRYKLMAMDSAPPGSIEEKHQKQIKNFYKFYEQIGRGAWTKWTYDNTNIDELWSQMSEADKSLLPFDVRACDWSKYYSNMYANQFGPCPIPQFEDLTEEKRAVLRKQLFYKNYMNY